MGPACLGKGVGPACLGKGVGPACLGIVLQVLAFGPGQLLYSLATCGREGG